MKIESLPGVRTGLPMPDSMQNYHKTKTARKSAIADKPRDAFMKYVTLWHSY